jgi:hypothetical protein
MSQQAQVTPSFDGVGESVLPLEGERPPLRVVESPVRRGALRERLVHALAQEVANAVVQKPREETLRFGLVTEPDELAEVGRLRLRVYQQKLPYLLQELSAEGLDGHDAHSFIFAAWRGDRMVASLRATRYPYETLRYVPEQALASWMGEGWKTDYLEGGRLLVDTTQGLNRVTPALVSYVGLYLHGLTAYRKFFGYARPKSRRSFGGFLMEQHSLHFRIPTRGEHSYTLFKGEFLKGVLFEAPRWLGALATRRLGLSASPEPRQHESAK